MKLKEYNVRITLSDPDNKGTQYSVTLDRVPREKVMEVKVPLAGALEMFEELVDR